MDWRIRAARLSLNHPTTVLALMVARPHLDLIAAVEPALHAALTGHASPQGLAILRLAGAVWSLAEHQEEAA